MVASHGVSPGSIPGEASFMAKTFYFNTIKLYRKFTFLKLVILGGLGSRMLRPTMGCNAIGRRPLLLDNGK